MNHRDGFSGTRFLFLLFLLPGFLIALHRGWLRLAIEGKDAYVETVMDFDELRLLAREEGVTLSDTLGMVSGRGGSSVGISEDTLKTLREDGRISIFDYADLRKLSLEGRLASISTRVSPEPGVLWIRSTERALLDRVGRHLSWKVPGKVERVEEQLLVLHKSNPEFLERVGLGFSPEYLKLAREKGLGIVLRLYNFPGLPPEAIRQILNELPEPLSVSALLFAEEEVLGNRGSIDTTITGLLLRAHRLGWVELTDQAGMDRLMAGLGGRIPIVKVHSIGRKEMDENYNVERATARWIRAVRDRRLKMLYIRCFFQDKKKFIGDLLRFNLDYLSGIIQRLEADGFKIPRDDLARKEEHRYSIAPISWVERLCMGVALLMGLPLLICFSRRHGLERSIVIPLGVLAFLSGILLPRAVFVAFAGLVGAFGFSTMGGVWAISRLEEKENPLDHWSRWIIEGAWFFLRLVLPSVIGGILIVGLHSESDYLLKFQQFRGIKLAFILPLLWIGLWSIRRYGGAVLSYFSRPLTVRDLAIGLFLIGGTALYLLRSGNVTFLKPSETEDLGRTFLENLLIARPRNKEFLIGYPAIFFFFFFRMRRMTMILPVLALFIEMGQVSVLNTFCHFHSPLTMAFIRGFNGLWTGLLVGAGALLAYLVCRIIASAGRKDPTGVMVGYFGFGNFGDELLWQTFVKNAAAKRPDYTWKILWGERPFPGDIPGAEPLHRHSPLLLLESLAGARTIVIPGGGVLQASTSSRSLLYYLALLAFGKMMGGRLLLPAQGLGPFEPGPVSRGPTDSSGSLLRAILRYVLDFSDFLSLRDRVSEKILSELPTPAIQAPVTTDLAFLADVPLRETGVKITGALVLGVILRAGVSQSPEIVRIIREWNKDHPGVRIVPFSMQPGEDEIIWGPGEKIQALDMETLNSPDSSLATVDALISMRLHGCILATLLGIPWLGVSYDPKVAGFARDSGWEFVVNPQEFSSAWFESAFQKLTENLEPLRATLVKIRAEKRALAEQDFLNCLSCLK